METFLALVVALAAGPRVGPPRAPQESAAANPDSPWIVLDRVDRSGRRPFRPDAVFARHGLDPDAAPDVEPGVAVSGESGSASWTLRAPDERGRTGGGPAHAYRSVVSAEDRVRLVALSGAARFRVGGTAYVGNVYGYRGWGGVPVLLRQGSNDVFVDGIRGSFELSIVDPPAELFVAEWDATLPDLIRGERYVGEGAVLVVNASLVPRTEVELLLTGDAPIARISTRVRVDLPPLGLTKVPVPLVVGPSAGEEPLELAVTVRARAEDVSGDGADADAGHTSRLRLSVRARSEPRRVTFRSAIDDSVQQYALLEPAAGPDDVEPGLVLSLHGASVDALNQARSYAAKPGWWLVSPTNRRPYGFDWQDWGRRDAYEALADGLARSGVRRGRVVLTGHSMGGHGTWHLAANDPDGFAAIGPSAGWRSFDTYGGGRPDGELRELWHAADAASSTESLLENLAQLPIYVLHGEDDRTVPSSEAHALEEALRARGADVESHYEADAGHWWDAEGPGAACVDWPPMFARFATAETAQAPDRVAFVTVDPGVDAAHHWVRVEQPLVYGDRARVEAERDREARTVTVTTENVRRLSLRLPSAPPGGTWRVRVDATDLESEADPAEPLRLVQAGAAWRRAGPVPPEEKRPSATGPFKRAFDAGFVFVVGTGGPPAGARVRAERARYEAATWWYRGNGRAAVVPDHELARSPDAFRGRNLILFGNADTCSVWRELVGDDGPIDAGDGWIRVGEHRFEGDALGATFVVRGTGRLIGAFADSGVRGARLGYLLAPFVSGVGYPDYAVFDAGIATGGDAGVLAAGWFDAAWRVGPGGRRFERPR